MCNKAILCFCSPNKAADDDVNKLSMSGWSLTFNLNGVSGAEQTEPGEENKHLGEIRTDKMNIQSGRWIQKNGLKYAKELIRLCSRLLPQEQQLDKTVGNSGDEQTKPCRGPRQGAVPNSSKDERKKYQAQ